MQDLSSLSVDDLEERVAILKECLSIVDEIFGDSLYQGNGSFAEWKETLRVLETELFERTVLVSNPPES